MIDDFLYVCDDAYNRQQFIDMEMRMLRALDFDLGIPLSYRFLRRYAKVQACCLHRPGFVHRGLTVLGWAMSPTFTVYFVDGACIALVSTCRGLFTVRSYRYAVACLQVARIEMPTLTLARYILETSLLDYWMSQQLDSKLAAASLLLALTMKRESDWVSRTAAACSHHEARVRLGESHSCCSLSP